MTSGGPRILDAFPYPVAYPYSLIFEASDASNRRWALCFTTYQLLRMVCLPLVSQYLREEVDDHARDSILALNRAIAAIRWPFFSDWITLVHTLRRHLPKVGIEPLLPRLGEALEALKAPEEPAHWAARQYPPRSPAGHPGAAERDGARRSPAGGQG